MFFFPLWVTYFFLVKSNELLTTRKQGMQATRYDNEDRLRYKGRGFTSLIAQTKTTTLRKEGQGNVNILKRIPAKVKKNIVILVKNVA